jgi:hypothetical protein
MSIAAKDKIQVKIGISTKYIFIPPDSVLVLQVFIWISSFRATLKRRPPFSAHKAQRPIGLRKAADRLSAGEEQAR